VKQGFYNKAFNYKRNASKYTSGLNSHLTKSSLTVRIESCVVVRDDCTKRRQRVLRDHVLSLERINHPGVLIVIPCWDSIDTLINRLECIGPGGVEGWFKGTAGVYGNTGDPNVSN